MPATTMGELARLKVYTFKKQSKKQIEAGEEPQPKKLGRVHNLVFSPDSRRVVGIMVKRPDFAGMVKQADRFLALDAMDVREGGIVCTREKDGFDDVAAKRLGLDLDRSIIWGGADVHCESGKFLGYVMDARFDLATGDVDCFCAQEGETASALVGSFEIPAAWVLRYSKGTMVVRDEAATLQLSGGLAGKAGEGYAVAKDKAKETAAKAGAAAGEAVDKGSHALGGALGRLGAGMKQAVDNFQVESGVGRKPTGEKAVAKGGKSVAGVAERTAGAKSAAAKPAADKSSSAKSSSVNRPQTDDVSKAAGKAARAVGEQLGKTSGMFSGFLREFKDASK